MHKNGRNFKNFSPEAPIATARISFFRTSDTMKYVRIFVLTYLKMFVFFAYNLMIILTPKIRLLTLAFWKLFV